MRAKERYGIDLTKAMIEDIVQQIKKRKAVFVLRQSASKTIWDVKVGEQTCRVVYNTELHLPATFLSMDMPLIDTAITLSDRFLGKKENQDGSTNEGNDLATS